MIDWCEIDQDLSPIYRSAMGEKAWPPLAMLKALLLSVWYDLSDVKLAEALNDRASFRRFCGFAASEPTPERTAFVRFRRELVRHRLDTVLFEAVTRQLGEKNVMVKTGTLVDATIIASASITRDEEARWSVQEIRRIAFRLARRRINSAHVIAWSLWRRAHQAAARVSHIKRNAQL